jgi:hypothetical protein
MLAVAALAVALAIVRGDPPWRVFAPIGESYGVWLAAAALLLGAGFWFAGFKTAAFAALLAYWGACVRWRTCTAQALIRKRQFAARSVVNDVPGLAAFTSAQPFLQPPERPIDAMPRPSKFPLRIRKGWSGR